MVKLIARSPCQDRLPIRVGDTELCEVLPGFITSLAPARGQEKALSEALKKAHGVGFPAPNRSLVTGDSRSIWFGPGQAMLLSAQAYRPETAAWSDQSDGWAIMRLQGPRAQQVFSRLVPINLNASVFKQNHTARSLLFHMPLSITRVAATEFQLMVFRSMATTAIHEIEAAMRSCGAYDA